MKLVACVIQPSKVETLKKALWQAGFRGMTITEAHGYGYQKGRLEPGKEDFIGEIAPKARVEVAVEDAEVEQVLELVVDTVRTGRIGDGKIFITPLDQVVRVRTGERGGDAL